MGNQTITQIETLKPGTDHVTVQGRIQTISNITEFKNKFGKKGKIANMCIEDTTGTLKVVLWTQNIKYLNRIDENDIITITNLKIVKGYKGVTEAQMTPQSRISLVVDSDVDYPEYEQLPITKFSELEDGNTYTIQSRIIDLGQLKTIPREKPLQLQNMKLFDGNSILELTLWNKDISLIDVLDLKVNDTIEVRRVNARYNYGKMNLSHTYNSRIVKGNFDIPEYEIKYNDIGDLEDGMTDVNIVGIVSKVHGKKSFIKNDGTEGYLRNVEIKDSTGTIMTTLWNSNASIELNKGDIIQILGAGVEFDDYNEDERLTMWNATISINVDINKKELQKLKSLIEARITPISDIEDLEEDTEIDIVGKVITLGAIQERDTIDGNVLRFRNITLGDETGFVQFTIWNDNVDYDMFEADVLKFENVKVYIAENGMSIKLNPASRITVPIFDEGKSIPSYDELVELLFTTKTLDKLTNNDTDVKTTVRVMNVGKLTTFMRRDGSSGHVRTVYVADNTKLGKLTLWDDLAVNVTWVRDTALTLENPKIKQEDRICELGTNSRTNIKIASPYEQEKVDMYATLKNKVYETKTVEELLEDEYEQVYVKGTITNVEWNDLLLPTCPVCHTKVTYNNTYDTYICSECGDGYDEPEYIMRVAAELEDDTGIIPIKFYGSPAVELIGHNMEEAIAEIDDPILLESWLDAIEGKEITVRVNSKNNSYIDSNTLSVTEVDYIN